MNPTLRSIGFQPAVHQGQRVWVLQDSLQLSDRQIMLPYPLAKMASMMDGSRSRDELHQLLCEEAGQPVSIQTIDNALQQLDDCFLLENARSMREIGRVRAEWRAQAYRPAAFASLSYPSDSAELDQTLNNYAIGDPSIADWKNWSGRAIVAPHIDYQRGGHIYSKVWKRAANAINEADLILIWGTDHSGGRASLTLSSIPYATPYGIMPTDNDMVGELAATIGEENAWQLELNHRKEHSIELAAVWLHHIRREVCPVVPILIGSFYHFTPDGSPTNDPNIVAFNNKLRELTAGKKVFSIASVDLAHVGPAFDSDYLMDDARKQSLAKTDERLMEAIANGDKADFYRQLAVHRNKNNVCGFSPTWMMLDFLGETRGQTVGYDQCSADANDTSVVSICGMLLD